MSAAILANESAEDALCELCNIGTGNALTSLGLLFTHNRIDLSLTSSVSGAQSSELPAMAGLTGLAVGVDFEGPVSGRIVTLMDEESAHRIPGELIGAAPEERLHDSILLEMGNIIVSSFLNAVATMLPGPLLPRPPTLRSGELGALLEREVTQQGDPSKILLLTNTFEARAFRGRIAVILTREVAEAITERLLS